MEIFNNRPRKIVCIDNSHNTFGDDNVVHLLKIGMKYTLMYVDVYSFYSLITLREFPNLQFNSVLFEEIYK